MGISIVREHFHPTELKNGRKVVGKTQEVRKEGYSTKMKGSVKSHLEIVYY